MRALRLHGPGDIRLDEVAAPTPDASTVIVRVEACGVCGSDVHFADGSARTGHVPITLGHEVAGTIVTAPGEEYPPGTDVVAEVGRFCLACPRCLEGRPNLCERAQVLGIHVDGGFADLIAVPLESVVIRPPDVPVAAAATAVDAGATALHAIERRAQVTTGETVLIIGAGGLGMYGIQWAQLAGAGAVIVADTRARALEEASALGVDETLLVEPGASVGRQVKLLSDGGVDAAIEFVGTAATVDAAVKSIRPGGRAVAVGVGMEPVVSLPVVLWSNHEYALMGSYGSLPGDTQRVLDALSAGTVVPPLTIDVPLADGAALLESLVAGQRSGPERPVIRP
jgi:propanol-preferring alcohol dehydrogenase